MSDEAGLQPRHCWYRQINTQRAITTESKQTGKQGERKAGRRTNIMWLFTAEYALDNDGQARDGTQPGHIRPAGRGVEHVEAKVILLLWS